MPPFSGAATARLVPGVGTWILSAPASARFSVGNLVVGAVHGSVPVRSAYAEIAEDGIVRDAGAVLDLGGIDTGHPRRDKHLRRPSLLDLDTHPDLTFAATSVRPGPAGWSVSGTLTARGVTRPIEVDAAAQEEPDGTVALHLSGRLDRRDYGVNAPRFLIGSVVELSVDVVLTRH